MLAVAMPQKLLAADVQEILVVSDEGVRDLVRRELLHPERVGLRRPINVFNADEVFALAGQRQSDKLDRLAADRQRTMR